jgi:hypothetical protein
MAMQNFPKSMVTTMAKKSRRIVYLADSDHGCDDRVLSHTGSLTNILNETISYSTDLFSAEIGDRWIELVRVPVDGRNEGWTHSRESNWVIDFIDVYSPTHPDSKHFEVVYCYCKYVPIFSAELVAIVDGDLANSKELVLA